tara:strand:- start:89 stop:727 length:639 start_codon:yes stop_codon:yes gene_type:complete
VVLIGAVAGGLALSQTPDSVAEQGPEVPAAFVAYVWSGEASGEFDASWQGGTSAPVLQTRELREPTLIEGRPHLHIAWVLPGRREVVSQEAWFRPSEDGTAWLCARRRVGGDSLDLVPPMPVLKTPLEVGATWTWEGRIGEASGQAKFEVLQADEKALVVRQVTTHGGAESTQTRTFEPGLGLVREEGFFPYEPRGDSVVVTRRREAATKSE